MQKNINYQIFNKQKRIYLTKKKQYLHLFLQRTQPPNIQFQTSIIINNNEHPQLFNFKFNASHGSKSKLGWPTLDARSKNTQPATMSGKNKYWCLAVNPASRYDVDDLA